METEDLPLPTRQRLGNRYELLALVGVGGMGSVYRARDTELDEVVALKMLLPELVASEDMLSRFKQEVKLARRVTHRNVARTFDIGEHEGQKFLTMEYVEGESLAVALARGRLSVADAVTVACEICAGLSAAHAAGVVHRDLKPDNVLLARGQGFSRVVITDFGIARAVGPAVTSHATMGAVIGTPAYMAPEQVEGGPIDARADIYAVGEIIYEMLTGHPAWNGENVVQIAAARLHRPPPDPRSLRRDIPDSLATAVVKAMARKPEDRFASASDLASALSSLTLPQINNVIPAPPSSAQIIAAKAHVASPAAAPAVTVDGDKTLAVLLFRNLGGSDDVYLADGLTEDLIDALSLVKGLRVRAFGAVRALSIEANATPDPRDIGQKLDVQVVVEGTLRKIEDKLRVTARLVSVADGFQLWARRFDKPASAFLEVADEIANAIGEALLVERKAAARHAPTDPAALELYLRARHEMQVSYREGTQRAIALFSEALRRAPHDPIILSGYALAQVREMSYGDNSDAAESVARSVVEEAGRIAPEAPETRLATAALALSVGESESAARSIASTFALGRPSAEAYELRGSILSETGPVEAAIQDFEIALALEPRLHHRRAELGRLYEIAGQSQRARDLFESVPDEALLAPGYWVALARWHAWRDEFGAIRALLAADTAGKIPAMSKGLMEVLATRKASPQMHAMLAARIGRGLRAKRRNAFFLLIAAEVLSFLGQNEEAISSLVEADKAGVFDALWFDHCPMIMEIRHDPRVVEVRAHAVERATRLRVILGF